MTQSRHKTMQKLVEWTHEERGILAGKQCSLLSRNVSPAVACLSCVCVLCRMVYTECTPVVCPCGDRCSNQRIQRHQSTVVFEKFVTRNRGYGVRTVNAIQSGTSTCLVYWTDLTWIQWWSEVGNDAACQYCCYFMRCATLCLSMCLSVLLPVTHQYVFCQNS